MKEIIMDNTQNNSLNISRAGVRPPFSALRHQTSMDQSNYAGIISPEGNINNIFRVSCEICCEFVPLWKRPSRTMTCEVTLQRNYRYIGKVFNSSFKISLFQHNFCQTCWEAYLTTKIKEGEVNHILCPAFGVGSSSCCLTNLLQICLVALKQEGIEEGHQSTSF